MKKTYSKPTATTLSSPVQVYSNNSNYDEGKYGVNVPSVSTNYDNASNWNF